MTLFPEMFDGPFRASIIGRAVQRRIVTVELVDLRRFGLGKRRITDDEPYGGGPGMVMRPEPLFAAVESVRSPSARVILLTPQGRRFDQGAAQRLATEGHLILIAGHYEGVDERVRQHLADEEWSIGDYVLTGGEIPCIVVVDAVVRLLPDVLGESSSSVDESFSEGLLEYPQYTRPARFREWTVPEVLLSGNHGEIAAWRRRQSLLRTLERRPDLLTAEQWDQVRRVGLSDEGKTEHERRRREARGRGDAG